jgi:hypothetical protein
MPVTVRAFLNLAAMATLAAMALFAVYRGYTVPADRSEFQSVSTSPLQTPLWLPHSLWFAGWVLFALCAAILAGHAAGSSSATGRQLNACTVRSRSRRRSRRPRRARSCTGHRGEEVVIGATEIAIGSRCCSS